MSQTLSAPSAYLSIRLLGGLRLRYGELDVRFNAPAKTLALLGYLLVHRDEKISREALAFTLWPDDAENKARANLRRHNLLLQQTLPQEAAWTIADHRSIQWNAACACEIDIAEFERLSERPETAAEAVNLYAGDLLPDLYDDWILPQRELLRRMQSVNLERLTERYRHDRDFAKAISTAQRLVAHEPWREDTIRTLMSLRYESGDRAGALAEYEAFALRLRRDMDVEPMPETVARYESILRNAPTYRSRTAEHADTPASTPVPFVGREAEFMQLESWWNRAARGHGRCALVSGEAGIGKSRLMAELRNMVDAQGGRAIIGYTTFPEAAPYQAVIEALRGALPMISARNLKPIWRASAAAVLPELRQLDEKLPPLVALEPERQQDRLLEALVRCFEAIAQTRPLLVVLEDVHWAGSATIAFLEYFTRRVESLPILIAATYRSDDTLPMHPLRNLRRSLRGTDALANQPLGRLSSVSVEQYVRAIPQLVGMPPEFAQRVHALSDGNPFFLGEIVRDCVASERTEPATSQSLQAVIASRVARLSAKAQAVAGIAAVAGRAFDIELIAAAGGISEDKVIESVDELLDLRLIRDAGMSAAGSYDFVFSHDLIQAHIYSSVPESARKRRHRRVGLVLEALHARSTSAIASDLARHFDNGGDPERAVRYSIISAENALAVYADHEALAALSRALHIEGEGPQQYDLLAMLETIYGRQGMRHEQLTNLDSLQAVAEASRDEDKICECLRRRILYTRATGNLAGQQRYLEALREAAARRKISRWKAVASEHAAALMISTGKYKEGCEQAVVALDGYGNAQDATGEIRSLCLIAEAHALLAQTTESQAAIDRARELAEKSSNETLVLRALCAASLAAYLNNHYDDARDFAQRGLDLSVTIGDREAEADCLSRLANIDGRRFAVDAAVTKYGQALEIYRALGKLVGEAIVSFNTGLLYLKIGEQKQALENFSRARSVFSSLKDLRGVTVCAINLGMIAYFKGRYAVACRIFTSALRLAVELGMPHLHCVALANLGAAQREAGDVTQALALQEEALRMRRSIAPMDIGSDLSDMGLTYLRVGDVRAALRIADEIAELDDAALQSLMFPQSVLWTAAQVYAAASLADRRRNVLQRALH
ncbi:MAG: AAA family ATPase, partial [Candidatus Eremiobacteraeota bacterium]|nr:AAA family ATPase [Candidatus Eremiobacteraeota bacterium]